MLHREHNIFQNYTSCGGTAVHFTFENPLFTPENQPFTLHRGALSNSTAAEVHRGDVSLPGMHRDRCNFENFGQIGVNCDWINRFKSYLFGIWKKYRRSTTKNVFLHIGRPFLAGLQSTSANKTRNWPLLGRKNPTKKHLNTPVLGAVLAISAVEGATTRCMPPRCPNSTQ